MPDETDKKLEAIKPWKMPVCDGNVQAPAGRQLQKVNEDMEPLVHAVAVGSQQNFEQEKGLVQVSNDIVTVAQALIAERKERRKPYDKIAGWTIRIIYAGLFLAASEAAHILVPKILKFFK